jgi:hypothetical protein
MKRTCLQNNTTTYEQNSCEFHLSAAKLWQADPVENLLNEGLFDPKEIQQVKSFFQMKIIKEVRIHSFLLILLFISQTAFSQTITQTVKGEVTDNETKVPLIGATVVVLGTNPLLGVTTDLNGNFKLKNVPIGRYNIQFNYMGYDPSIVSEILVSSGKETDINIGLKQSVNHVDEVTVKAHSNKDKPLNTMASISARTFTVEETRRYAGGVDDPARMASAFAGVTVGNIQDNAIIIRGNSPKGLSWRLEGVEIPNPNHFSGGNVAGGGIVTIFSSQLLSNSDFFTGAFPAEYGNALAGVFDMKLRNGNSDKRESTFQAGMLGIDISSEGPFVKGKNASYLFNYRYSTFSLVSLLGILPDGVSQIPKFQDLSFKLNFPTKKCGTFSLWGIGGIDNNKEPNELDSTKWVTDWDRIYYNWNLTTAVIGFTHKLIAGKKSYINTTLAASTTINEINFTSLDDNLIERPYSDITDNTGKITLSSFINHKFSPKYTIKAGFNFNTLFYNLDLNSVINNIPETYQNFVKEDGYSQFVDAYIQSKYDITGNFSVNAGVNANYFALNNDISVDPRVSLKWEFYPKHSLSFGYGKHSQMEELKFYLINRNVNGTIEYPNKNLELSHAQHVVLGYDWLINDNLRLKVEPYYQYLYNVPGIPDSSYSFINFKQDWMFRDSLTNNSSGRNIGIDFTLERFLNNNYYYLFTASVFDSKYKGDDGIWRNTRYDKGFVVNLLVGKEFFLKNNSVLGLNARLNYTGGERISPIDMEKTLQKKAIVYDESNAFEDQLPSRYNLDLTVTYRINREKHSGVWALQLKNALGTPENSGDFYNLRTNKIEKSTAKVILPVLSYKIEF